MLRSFYFLHCFKQKNDNNHPPVNTHLELCDEGDRQSFAAWVPPWFTQWLSSIHVHAAPPPFLHTTAGNTWNHRSDPGLLLLQVR